MVKKLLFRFLYFIGIGNLLRLQKKNTLTVLSLHRVSGENDYFWNPMKPATFEKLLQYVSKYYSVISFSDIPVLTKNAFQSRPYLILSFDDGYYDFYEHALPLLKTYNLPSNHNIVNDCATYNQTIWTQRLNTIFNYCKVGSIDISFLIRGKIISLESFNGSWMKFYYAVYDFLLTIAKAERQDILAKKERELSINTFCKMMNWEQILECSKNGVEIGCHTYTHDVLSTIMDVNILRKEVIQSAIEIEEKMNKKVTVLALPNGKGNEKIDEVIANSEIKYVLYVDDKINRLSANKSLNINNVYRINLTEESFAEMVLRIELFHTKVRKYA